MPIPTQKKVNTKMNQDNRRLKEIQEYKQAYSDEMDRAETIADIITYHKYIQDLEKEEKEILERNGVKI